jgi:hypothetical protein
MICMAASVNAPIEADRKAEVAVRVEQAAKSPVTADFRRSMSRTKGKRTRVFQQTTNAW